MSLLRCSSGGVAESGLSFGPSAGRLAASGILPYLGAAPSFLPRHVCGLPLVGRQQKQDNRNEDILTTITSQNPGSPLRTGMLSLDPTRLSKEFSSKVDTAPGMQVRLPYI
jgi:hypothetical protein